MTNPYETPNSELLVEKGEWKRSRWLTGWLWFSLITTLANIPLSYIMADAIMAQSEKINMSIIYSLMVCSVFSAISVVGILNYKKLCRSDCCVRYKLLRHGLAKSAVWINRGSDPVLSFI